MGTLETEVARHIAAILDQTFGLPGQPFFRANSNGPLIHITTSRDGKTDAWVLTVEWDGER
jgi:hypothetical protein